MKFTNGYWLTRKEISPIYAVEYSSHDIKEDTLIVHAATMHVKGRADSVNQPLLTITLSSPMENVIKVSVEHFRGERQSGPYLELYGERPKICIKESEEELSYMSGNMRAVISKNPNDWRIAYYSGERFLTETSYRNMAHMTNNRQEKCYMVEQLSTDVGEYIYGLGERFTPFVKNGQCIDMWNEDGGTASELAYKNIPFYISNKGYGVLTDSTGDVSYEINSEKVERVQFSVEGERLDYYIVGGGSTKGTIETYTMLTGRPALPPAWTFGLWLTTSFSTDYDEKIVEELVQGMEAHQIPLQVFHFDSFWMKGNEWCNFKWNDRIFPNPEAMLSKMHERGIKTCVWINPYIAQNSELFDEAREKKYLIQKVNGSVWQTDLWQAGMGIVDFTNPDAVSWYQEKLRFLLNMGVDSFKTDFGERIPVKDIVYYDHSNPVKMHNYYSLLYNKAVFEVIEEVKGKGQAAVFARAATVGGQQYPVHWGGDCTASYLSMAETLRGGLSLSLCGFGFWSHDMGGFEQTATPDIYKRWCAFGLLSSHSRLHGGVSYRVPWEFDEEACEVLKFFAQLKCTLMPYLYQKAVEAHTSGIPMHRPMFLEFPEDPACETLDCQYMLGDALLVAPVFRENGDVQYYLPEGTWTHLLDGRIEKGGRWIKENYGYFSIPLWLRENTLLPIGDVNTQVEYDYTKDFTLKVPFFTEGGYSKIEIPNVEGEESVVVTAISEEGKIFIAGSESENWKVDVAGYKNYEIQQQEEMTIIMSE
ncbi:MAG: alpha-xylosidase [Lachnospiraceae bacterium]|nr:alpha-xylosidase [Lachnospiraceae bacterium]